MPMSIRKLTGADASAFRALRLRALQEHPEAFTSSYEEDVGKPLEASAQRIDATSDNVFWGAFVDDELRGMIGLVRETRAKNRHSGDVVAMYVAPEWGRRGIGRDLLKNLIDHARDEMALEQLVLTVTRDNASASELYKAVGFTTFGLEPRAIKVGGEYFDKEHMILSLQRTP